MCHVHTEPGENIDLDWRQMHAMYCDEIRPKYSQPLETFNRTASVFLFTLCNFIQRLVDMHHDRVVSLGSDGENTCKRFIADGIGRMRRKHQLQSRLIGERVAGCETLLNVGFGIRSIRCWELQNCTAQRCPHAGFQRGSRGDIVIEVHISEACGTRADHFGCRQFGAVKYIRFREVLCFVRPDVVVEPRHQRCVVCKTAHQCHRGMRMQINESGDKHMIWQNHLWHAREAPTCDIHWKDCQNSAVIDD